MKNILRYAVPFAVVPTLALAVYAPIPEQEQGKAFTYRLGGSVYEDSNIFGAATGEISSVVYNLTGGLSYNGSVDPQTFLSASYEISNDYEVDRPGVKNLTSHNFDARLAHQFSEATNIDVSGNYSISKNPQSLLAGVPVNTDQSFNHAQLDGKYTTAFGQKTGVVLKYRYQSFNYDNPSLQDTLNRNESLAGLELSYALLPETKLVGEYRYQSINYSSDSSTKDKTSNFLMGGADYSPGEKLMVSGRLGFEDRHRDSAGNTTVPYAELSAHYAYAEGSFIATGYNYTIEESSDPVRFLDTKVNRFFVNVQHRLTGTFTASGSIDYEPSQLQGRGAQADLSETTTHFGLGLSWLPTKNWTISTTFDLDDVNSDDPSRGQNRQRYGLSARYTF